MSPQTSSFENQWGSWQWDPRAIVIWEMTFERITHLDALAQGKPLILPRVYMQEVHLLILKNQLKGQASKLTKIQESSGVRGWWAPSLHTIFLFSKTLGSSLQPLGGGGVPSLYSPSLISPVIKHYTFFLSSRHYPWTPLLPYSSQLLPFWSLSLLHSRVPSQRGHFTCFWCSGFFPLVLFIVGATLGIHLDHLALEVRFSSVQSLNHVWLFVTPWIAACQASLPITNSRSYSNSCPSSRWCHPASHLIPCCPLLLLPPSLPSIRVFSNESTLHMR